MRMSRRRNLSDSRHNLLQPENTSESRTSLEEAYRSSSDIDARSDSLDLDELEKSRQSFRHKFSWFSKHPPWSSGYTYDDSLAKANKNPLPKKGLKGWKVSRKTCILITLILALGLVTIVGSGALWVYKSAPRDGVGRASTYCILTLT